MVWDIIELAVTTGTLVIIGFFAYTGLSHWIDKTYGSFWARSAMSFMALTTVFLMLLVPWIELGGGDMFPSLVKASIECISI